MRRSMLAATCALAGLLLAGCGSLNSGGGSGSSASAAPCSRAGIAADLYRKGVLTVATDRPAYPPWFSGNDPANGKGYESAVAYAVAARLGFRHSQVKWAYEPFNDSYAPGPKHFDFDINEISVTPERARVVTFSTGYYAVSQALVALKGSPIVTRHTPAELKSYSYGDQIGTTSLAFINSEIRPTPTPRVYETLNDVKQALQTRQIAAFVTDTPTAQYISADEIPNSLVVAQFRSSGEHYGLLFRKGNPLAACVDKAITALARAGTLTALEKRYLQSYLSIPVIRP